MMPNNPIEREEPKPLNFDTQISNPFKFIGAIVVGFGALET